MTTIRIFKIWINGEMKLYKTLSTYNKYIFDGKVVEAGGRIVPYLALKK